MLTNLINRIIELATGRVVDAVNFDEVQAAAVERIVEDGIDYSSLAGELDLSDVAGEIDLSDVAEAIDTYDLSREIMSDHEFRERVVDAVVDSVAFEREIERITAPVESMEVRLTKVEERLAALPENDENDEPTIEVPASLTDRLLTLAVERLLTLADEAVRDGRA